MSDRVDDPAKKLRDRIAAVMVEKRTAPQTFDTFPPLGFSDHIEPYETGGQPFNQRWGASPQLWMGRYPQQLDAQRSPPGVSPAAPVLPSPPPAVPPYQPPQGAANPTMPWRGLPSPTPGLPMGGPSGPPAPAGTAATLPTPPPMPPMAQIDPAAPIAAYNASTDDRMQRLKLLDALNSGSYYS